MEWVNLNYCQICGKWLGMDDYDGICCACDDEEPDGYDLDLSDWEEDSDDFDSESESYYLYGGDF